MIYVKHSDGSMTPAFRGTSNLLGLRPGEQYVEVRETAWNPPKPSLESIIAWHVGWRIGGDPGAEVLADKIRAAFPEAGL